ncbi:MAG: phage holin [Eubacterium sp.]
MKINIKARMKNKTFVITMATLVVSFVYQLLSLFEIVPKLSENTLINLITMAVNILATFGVLVDPTTDGIADSDRAMTYCTENDERRIDENEEGVINE